MGAPSGTYNDFLNIPEPDGDYRANCPRSPVARRMTKSRTPDFAATLGDNGRSKLDYAWEGRQFARFSHANAAKAA